MNKDWINVDDRLPPHEDAVLTFNGEYVAIASFWCGSWIDTVHGESEVTHWMELPEMPNVKLRGSEADPLECRVGHTHLEEI